MKIKWLPLLISAFFLSSHLIGTAEARARVIQKAGTGSAEPGIENVTQKRANAREAAIVVAQFEMLDYIKGLRYKDGSTVEDKMKSDPAFSTVVDKLVSSAGVVSNTWAADDSCTAVIQLRISEIMRVLGKVTNL